jgi:hypothetical protein
MVAFGVMLNGVTLATWGISYAAPYGAIYLAAEGKLFTISRFVDRLPSLPYWSLVALVAVAIVFIGRRREWYAGKGRLFAGTILTCSVIGSVVTMIAMNLRTMKFRMIYSNLLEMHVEAEDYLLNNNEILLTRGEAPPASDRNRNWKARMFPEPQLGEDYSANLPYRNNQTLVAQLPDGSVAIFDPMDNRQDRRTVRPKPADGKQTEKTQTRYIEITYRGGVPDGPYRVFSEQDGLLGEANYSQGRLTGPCWNYMGEKPYDENVSAQPTL